MSNRTPLFDVIIPTHAHPLLLPVAVRSVLDQSVDDIRLVVIGDGVADDTRDVMSDVVRWDTRIEFVDLPKAGRTGERHRHLVLSGSQARFIAYLGDDDLFAPDHLAIVSELLEHHDVVTPLSTAITPDGKVDCYPWSLAEEPSRRKALEGISLFSLTGLCHTLDAYRRLPFGWRDTPEGYYTDQYMLLQFLAEPWCRFGLTEVPTVAHLADSQRRDMSADERLDELLAVRDRLGAPSGWAEFRREALGALRRTAAHHWWGLSETHEGLVRSLARADELQRQVDDLTTQLAHSIDRADDLATQLAHSLDRAGELQRQVDDLTTQLAHSVDHAHDVSMRLATAEQDLRALSATRAIRLRDAVVRNRVLRALLARRP